MTRSAADDLETSIERYLSVAERKGFSQPTPLPNAEDPGEQLALIRATVAPRQLPAEIEWFWSRWGTHVFNYRISQFPDFIAPSMVPGVYNYKYWPRALLPIGYQSHCYLAVELVYPGAVPRLVYFQDDIGFRPHALSMASIFDALSDAMDASQFEIDTDGSRFVMGDEVERRLQDQLDNAGIESNERGPFSEFEIPQWPRRWQSQQGIERSAWRLTGATHTIAELQAARRLGPAEATVVGLKGGGMTTAAGENAGSLTVVSDDSGAIDVWIPATVADLGTSVDHRYELDITAAPSSPDEPRLSDFDADVSLVERLALLRSFRAALDAAQPVRDHLRSTHAIAATAVRPLQTSPSMDGP